MSNFLILGLGNPGDEYEDTYHNAGVMAAKFWHKNSGMKDLALDDTFFSLVQDKKLGKNHVTLALPQTFMNKSGKAAEVLAKKFKVKPDTVIILHDDADIQLGKIKIVQRRNSGGHKGVESIMRALKSKEMIRIRIGTTKIVSKKGIWKDRDLMDTVVKKIPGGQKPILKKALKNSAEAIDVILKEGIGKAMSVYNSK